ncbi:DUF397 domain-containing protein [Streptomyces avermitilis]|uniref:DUF397 domain-containing protein n=1 Tax=Streptomyces avermitilis TaxID=33903 RepID=UPI0033C5226E
MASSELDLSSALWRTSSYSNASGGDCVEVAANFPGIVPVRDSRRGQDGPVLLLTTTAWSAFVGDVKR